jgi:hypothetical protein
MPLTVNSQMSFMELSTWLKTKKFRDDYKGSLPEAIKLTKKVNKNDK